MRHVRSAGLTMLFVAITLLASEPAQASPVAYEGFSIPLAPPFQGGAGFSGPWISPAGSQGYSWSDATLRINGLQVSGGSVSGDASDAALGIAMRNLATFVATYPTLYVSFLVQPRGTLNEGAAGGFSACSWAESLANLFVGKPGGGAQDQYASRTWAVWHRSRQASRRSSATPRCSC